MSTERTDDDVRARRYLAGGRVKVISATSDAVQADVFGCAGSYRVTWDAGGMTCTCPAAGRCGHLLALQLISDGPGDALTRLRRIARSVA